MRTGTTALLSTVVGAGLALWIGRADWDELWWKLAGPELSWPTVESYDLELDVTVPGRFDAQALVALSGVESRRLTFLLNETLEISGASAAGEEVGVEPYRRLPSRYHREGRVVQFTLPSVPEDGRASISMRYGGAAERGRTGSDWRGILFVDTDEVRMCEQTIFYPQVPLSLEGSAKAKAPYALTVVAPRDWEVFVPATGGAGAERSTGDSDERRWSFESDQAGHPALLGGRLERTETVVGGSRIVTLLRAEHAELASGFVREASSAIESYTQSFGAIDAGVLGIVEIHCRDSSYNWAAEGVMAFDRGALSGGVPTPEVAHEVAHLWWGQCVDAAGPGERFLTEGLAEYSAWLHLLQTGRGELLQRTLQSARRRLAQLSESGRSVALADVSFGGPDYTALAYEKGPLVLRSLGAQLEEGQLNAALGRLVELGRERQVGLEDFVSAVREASGLEQLSIPWLDAPGDVALSLEEVRVGDGRVSAAILARPVPGDSEMEVRGAPVALLFGGRGWSERRTLLLEGERTPLSIELGERDLAYLRLDPGESWTSRIDNGFQVLDGARLVTSEPPGATPVEFGGSRIELRFDRSLAVPTLESMQRAQWGPTSGGRQRLELEAVAWVEGDRALVVETRPWHPDVRYQMALTSLVDREGLPVVPTAFDLDVAASTDREPARIVASVPPSGASVTAPGGELELRLTFDEPMRAGYAIKTYAVRDIESRGLRCPASRGRARWDETGRTLIWPVRDLEVGQTYALPISDVSCHDLSGNGCEEFDLIFTVVAQ